MVPSTATACAARKFLLTNSNEKAPQTSHSRSRAVHPTAQFCLQGTRGDVRDLCSYHDWDAPGTEGAGPGRLPGTPRRE